MLIRIERQPLGLTDCLIGSLLVDGRPLVLTREDPPRADGVFVPGESALPPGLYNLTMSWSRRFAMDLPLVVSTQVAIERRRTAARIGMRFHPGEPEADVGGEILLGRVREGAALRQTAEAFADFSAIIRAALDRGEAIDVEIN